MSYGSIILGPRHHQESASRWYLGELEDLVLQQEWAHGACHKSRTEVVTRMHPAARSEFYEPSSRFSTSVQHIIASLESKSVSFNAFVITRASSGAPSYNGAPHLAVQQNMRLNIMFASKERANQCNFVNETLSCEHHAHDHRRGLRFPGASFHHAQNVREACSKEELSEILGFTFKCRCGVLSSHTGQQRSP